MSTASWWRRFRSGNSAGGVPSGCKAPLAKPATPASSSLPAHKYWESGQTPPYRAEANDVTNAILMAPMPLCFPAETANSAYPVGSVNMISAYRSDNGKLHWCCAGVRTRRKGSQSKHHQRHYSTPPVRQQGISPKAGFIVPVTNTSFVQLE